MGRGSTVWQRQEAIHVWMETGRAEVLGCGACLSERRWVEKTNAKARTSLFMPLPSEYEKTAKT